MPFVESFDEFRTRMNCESRQVGSRVLFQNGAMSDGPNQHFDPPAEKFERLGLQGEFLAYKLKQEVAAFREYQKATAEQAQLSTRFRNLPTPDTTAPEKLQRGQARIEKLRGELRVIIEQLETQPVAVLRRERAAQEVVRRQENADVLKQIQGVEI